MASRNFTNLADHLARAAINFGTGTFKAVIVDTIPSEANLDGWRFRDAITGEAPATGGYVAGGFAVTATVGAVDAANNRVPVTFSAATPTYEAATISGVGCIIYQDTGVAGTSPVAHFVDWLDTVASTNGNFEVTFSTPLYINA